MNILVSANVPEIVGAPLSDWSWLKSTIPVSLGGLGIRFASTHASAAYISSSIQSTNLVVGILNRSPLLSSHINSTLSHLTLVANWPNWSSTEEIDVPICQRRLCRAID